MKLQTTSIEELLNNISSIPNPPQTRTYIPVPFDDLITECYDEVSKEYSITKYNVYTTNNDQRLHCSMFIDRPDSDLALGFGIVTSHDKSIPVQLAAHGIVKVCYNGMVSQGNVLEVRKHTGTVWNDIRLYIKHLIMKLETCFKGHVADAKKLLATPIHSNAIPLTVGKAWELGAFDKMEHYNTFKREMSNATNGKGDFIHPNMWSVYNWGTEALKQSSISNTYKQHQLWNNLILEQVY